LLTLGELGSAQPLNLPSSIKEILTSFFDHESEGVKTASSTCLGQLAVGDLDEYLPLILSNSSASPSHQYLYLTSIKQVILNQSGISTQSLEGQIIPLLQSQCQEEEEGVRSVSGECLGLLLLSHPTQIIPILQDFMDSRSPLLKWSAGYAIKISLSKSIPSGIDVEERKKSEEEEDNSQEEIPISVTANQYRYNVNGNRKKSSPLPIQVSQNFDMFVPLVMDEDLDVKKIGFQVLTSCLHYHPSLLTHSFRDTVLPALFAGLALKLVRVVDLGPFKHKIDDG